MTPFLGALSLLAFNTLAQAAAVRTNTGFTTTALAANDDGSTGLVNTGINFNFYGVSGPNVYVNNNGNITFNNTLSTFTPFGLLTSTQPIIAAFFGDVDTRAGSLMTYGTSTIDGKAAFGVNWVDVGYYAQNTDKLNSFQLVLIDRSDVAAGDFDFELNFDKIQWETGEASGGTNGLGGSSARVGWTNGAADKFELAGSGVNGAFIDGGPNALVSNSLNSSVDGRYTFNVRSGTVQPPAQGVPDGGSTLAMLGLAVGALLKFKSLRKV